MKIRFGSFNLDLDRRQLTRDGSEIHLAPKAFQLLETLAVNRPKVLSKSALQERLWPHSFVVEGNLSHLVAEIREALDDRGPEPAWIRTAHGFGYAFCGKASIEPSHRESRSERPSCWLEWGDRHFQLTLGEHIIGRDPDVEVSLDSATVARRHARLVVTTEGAVLEDLGTKNGTLRGDERVIGPIQLADGDALHIGSLLIRFHVRGL